MRSSWSIGGAARLRLSVDEGDPASFTVDAVGSSALLDLAKARPADAMGRGISEFVRRTASDADLAARLERQRRNRRGVLLAREMGILHAEFDDTTFAEIRSAIAQLGEAELDLEWTELHAPSRGVVADLTIGEGTFAKAGQALPDYVPDP